jgi:aspartate/methionine/tyrosine aminotransferase
MTPEMNKALSGIQKSGIRTFTQLAKSIDGCMFLTLGEPDLNTAESVKSAAKRSLDDNLTHYPENNGQPYLREAISAFESERNGLRYSPDEIIVTVGATEALFAALFGIINPGDEVIVPTPAFGLYESIIKLCRGVCVGVDTSKTGFQITRGQLREAISPRTKAIVLTSPNNPTGCVYSRETLGAIHDAVKDLPVFVVCDEVYRQIIYTDDFFSFSGFADMRDRLIVVQSFSKPYAMTGWRVGYLMADAPVKAQLEKVHQYDVVSVSSFVQHACVEALRSDVSGSVALFRARRDYVCSRLEDIGLGFQKPDGAFYVFPSIAEFGMDSTSFCTRMAREAKLACTPGACFGADGFIRISYCYGDDALREGMDRLERFAASLR